MVNPVFPSLRCTDARCFFTGECGDSAVIYGPARGKNTETYPCNLRVAPADSQPLRASDGPQQISVIIPPKPLPKNQRKIILISQHGSTVCWILIKTDEFFQFFPNP